MPSIAAENRPAIKPDIKFLEDKARQIRRETFEMVIGAGKGHLGGSFSAVEVEVALYYGGILRFDPNNPKWEDRDIFVLSKGHSGNSLYVLLANLGFFPKSELANFSKDGSMLGQHVDMHVPGSELVTGSLGHGLGVGAGIAFGYKLDGRKNLVFVMIGDGESQEGSIWEAAMFAGHRELNNLVVILDRNQIGSEDFTEQTARLEPLADKWRAFGWEVRTVDGHSFDSIFRGLDGVRDPARVKPLMVISNTVKGRGLSSMQNSPRAHHTMPKGEELENLRKELT